MVNPQWEYFNAKARKSLSNSTTYSRRKYNVETVFGNLKAYLGFKKFTVRGLKKAKEQIGIALMALNMKKIADRLSIFSINSKKRKNRSELPKMKFRTVLLIYKFLDKFTVSY